MPLLAPGIAEALARCPQALSLLGWELGRAFPALSLLLAQGGVAAQAGRAPWAPQLLQPSSTCEAQGSIPACPGDSLAWEESDGK